MLSMQQVLSEIKSETPGDTVAAMKAAADETGILEELFAAVGIQYVQRSIRVRPRSIKTVISSAGW